MVSLSTQVRTSGMALIWLGWTVLVLGAGEGVGVGAGVGAGTRTGAGTERLFFCSELLSSLAGLKLGNSIFTASGLCGKLVALSEVFFTSVVSFALGSDALVACMSF